MKTWVLYAIVSMIFAGVTSVMAKIGLNGIPGEVGLAIRTSLVFVIIIAFTMFAVPPEAFATVTRNNL